MDKRQNTPKGRKDFNQLAKSIVDRATGQGAQPQARPASKAATRRSVKAR